MATSRMPCKVFDWLPLRTINVDLDIGLLCAARWQAIQSLRPVGATSRLFLERRWGILMP